MKSNSYICGGKHAYCNVDNDDKKAQTSKKIPENCVAKKLFGQSPRIEVTRRNIISNQQFLSPQHPPVGQQTVFSVLRAIMRYTKNGQHLYNVQDA